ncbi:MAG: Rossmann-like and DUF2520 domain-containing protein [Cyclobacteriaceae bacterium]
MADTFDISFIGSGNVAWHLAPALENSGHQVREVYSRNPENTELLLRRLYSAEPNETLDFTNSKSKVFFIAVSDDAIQQIACEIVLPDDAIIVHTSGSTPIETLNYTASEYTGVFYPLQTFSKMRKLDMGDVPILIEAEHKETLQILGTLARSISKNVYKVNSRDRLIAHISAVYACNFSNYLYGMAEKMLNNAGLDFDLLKPLIAETVNKSFEIGPYDAQTGPAVRGDLRTLDKHIEVLKDSDAAKVYTLLSQLILDEYGAE